MIHLQILYQIIFNAGLVPDIFSVGVSTPILKKSKDPAQYEFYRLITVSPVLCQLMEFFAIDEINVVCFLPDT